MEAAVDSTREVIMIATKTTVREWQPWYKKVWNWATGDMAPLTIIEYKLQSEEDMKVGTLRTGLSAEGTKRLQVGKRYEWDMDVVNIIDEQVLPDPLIFEPDPLSFDD